ncbi:hypothetical protein [Pararhizobium arenae]|uniref:hypothetical protein n=1 Tax=Pararhizobium arenae TaxID=1856850 RepID=UPI00094AFEBE|nr:hypothetical protein [Pararhizobium arenae]
MITTDQRVSQDGNETAEGGVKQIAERDIVARWREGPPHRAWVGGGTWRLTPVTMTAEAYERRTHEQWLLDVADATVAPLRI